MKIVTIRVDLTWEGKQAQAIDGQSEKKLKMFLKQLTGASDVYVINCNSWDDDNEYINNE